MRKPGLEIIRAIAALAVVACHIHVFKLVSVPTVLVMLTGFATEAVIIFFVLSGVVITLSVDRRASGPPSVGRFLWERLVRIYPIYLVALGAAALVSWQLMGEIAGPELWLGNLAFLQSLSRAIVATPDTNPPLWSLAFEMAYYTLFAVSLWRPLTMKLCGLALWRAL